jgi:hypothetical protein
MGLKYQYSNCKDSIRKGVWGVSSDAQQNDSQASDLGIVPAAAYRLGALPENHPIFADSQSYRYADLPDNRPIYASQTDGETPLLLTHTDSSRPISPGSALVLTDVTLPLNRPLFSSEMTAWPTFTLSGERPIAPSQLQVQVHPDLPNQRPIGSNEIDNPQELMGFID